MLILTKQITTPHITNGYFCFHIIQTGTCSSKNNYNLTSETQSCPAGNQVESLVVLPLSVAWLVRWPDVWSTEGGQTELAVLPVRAVTEHHCSELQSRTCSEQNKSYFVTKNYEISTLLI